VISADTLPDDVLLAVFHHYVNDNAEHLTQREEAWQSLVHVCRRWRCIIFGSPRHLNLQLVCQGNTPARDTLDVWPALPLIIWCYGDYSTGSVDNIVAVLEHSDCICQIDLWNVQSSYLEIFLAKMQQPFPELTDLFLDSEAGMTVVPNSFLGGSAPHLRTLALDRLLFPGLPKLILSATHLYSLSLDNIPHSGYISPEEMVATLSTLTSLEYLMLKFQSPRSCPDLASRRLPPSTRSVLLVLKRFRFKGASEYLEGLVTRIDAPQLNDLGISFFNDIIFDMPRFMRFISRTPTSRALEKAYIALQDGAANVRFSSRTSRDGTLNVKILCRRLDWQLSSLEQVCTLCLPPLSMLEDLYFYEPPHLQPDWKGDIEIASAR
jgi:hypothetical protein